jgi:hypothetical protein
MAHDNEHPELAKPRHGQAAGDDVRDETNGEPPRADVVMAAAAASDVRRMEPPQRASAHAESAARAEAHHHPRSHRSGSGVAMVLLAALVALPAGALGAWAYLKYLNPPAAPAGQTDPLARVTPAHDVAPPPPAISAEEVKHLTKGLESLSDRVDRLQEKFAAIPRLESAPDLTALKAQVENLSKDDATFVALPGRISALGERVAGLEKSMAELRAALAPVEGQVKKTGSSALASMTAPASRTVPDSLVADSALAEGVQLFKRGKYAEALAVFGKLAQSNPDDARVWYFAALANGLKTGQWHNETERLVNKGVERERAGTPDTAKINSAFADLTQAKGRDWLASVRKVNSDK